MGGVEDGEGGGVTKASWGAGEYGDLSGKVGGLRVCVRLDDVAGVAWGVEGRKRWDCQ